MKTLTYTWLILLILTGVGVWFTASQVLSIIWAVELLVGGLFITGVIPSLYRKLKSK